MSDKNKKHLTAKEFDIMQVLWNSDKSLTASEILSINPNLNINTINSSIKSLMKKEFIDIDDIVYSGTVLTRAYKPLKNAGDYVSDHFSSKSFDIFSSLIKKEQDSEVIHDLEKLIAQKKAELREEK